MRGEREMTEDNNGMTAETKKNDPTMLDVVKDFIGDAEVMDFDFTFPEDITDDASCVMKLVIDQDGDEVEKTFILKMVIDDNYPQGE
jgi:hypothetical protein